MAQQLQICDIDEDLQKKMKKFKFRKEENIAAIIMKIKKSVVIEVEEHEDVTIEELKDELDENHPTYILLSYVHNTKDGRKTYPLCFFYISPSGCKPEENMMYAGTKQAVVNAAQATKVYDLRSIDEFTEEFLVSKLAT